MTMAALFSSRIKVLRLTDTAASGIPSYTWKTPPGLASIDCRIDVGFLRPGKDQPMPVEAGKAPPRVAVLYCAPKTALLAGDRVVCIPNRYNDLPVTGTFEIRVPPDEAQDFSRQHHIEVQVIEVALSVAGGPRAFPGGS